MAGAGARGMGKSGNMATRLTRSSSAAGPGPPASARPRPAPATTIAPGPEPSPPPRQPLPSGRHHVRRPSDRP
eukprot:4467787-Pyramimonas_sp.AAC.1